MSDTASWARGHLQELDSQECRELLSSKSVGRIAFCSAEGPVVLPVNFRMGADAIVFRTSAHNTIAVHVEDLPVAFEVDEMDEYTQSGWSVLARGTAHFVMSPGELPTDARPDAWPDGIRSLFVSVPIDTITGRRVFPS